MDELAVVGGIDLGGVDADDRSGALGERARGVDRSALVPESADDRGDDENQPDQRPDEGIDDALQPGLEVVSVKLSLAAASPKLG